MKEEMIQCVAAKADIKLWTGKKYIMAELGQEIELPKDIARLEAKSGFVRMIGPK
jgi:hypothetical protein